MVSNNILAARVLALGAVVLMAAGTGSPASAQTRGTDAQGRQTIGPSEIPQQPMLKDELANPRITGGARSNDVHTNDFPGMTTGGRVVDMPGARTSTQQELENPNLPKTEQPGDSLTMPPGIPTDVRIGPVEPTPDWERAVMAGILIFQLIITVLWGITAYIAKARADRLEKGGHYIEAGRKEELLHR
jgi:hypothetical protein